VGNARRAAAGQARAYRRARVRLINREHRRPRQGREGKITGNRKLIADLVSGGSRTRPDPAGRAGCFITLNTIDPKTARSLTRERERERERERGRERERERERSIKLRR